MDAVLNEGINTGEKDYSALISKIKQSGADLVYFGGLYTEGGLIVRQMRDQGVKAPLMGGDGITSDEFATVGGPACRRRADDLWSRSAQPAGRKGRCGGISRQEIRAGGLHALCTLSGSRMRAKDTRPEPEFAAEVVVAEALRDAANRGPSELVAEISPHARQTPRGKYPVARGGNRGRQSAAQTSSVAGRHTACQVYVTITFTVAPQHRSSAAKRQVQTGHSGRITCVTDATCGGRCRL